MATMNAGGKVPQPTGPIETVFATAIAPFRITLSYFFKSSAKSDVMADDLAQAKNSVGREI